MISNDFFWAKGARASSKNIIYWSIGFGLTSRNMMQMAVARTEEAKFGSARST
jgi:hypothetical protein